VIAVLAFLLFAKRALKHVLVPQRAGAGVNYATYDAPLELEEQANEIETVRQGKANEKRILIRDDIITNTKNDPKTTSNLVRKWLRESE